MMEILPGNLPVAVQKNKSMKRKYVSHFSLLILDFKSYNLEPILYFEQTEKYHFLTHEYFHMGHRFVIAYV